MGGQKGVALFYQYLSGHHTIVMAAAHNNGAANENIILHRVLYDNKKMIWNIFRLSALKKMIKAQGIDCIIAEHSYAAWMAWLLKKSTGVPFIIHSHNLEAFRFKYMKRWWWKWYRHYERWMHQKADHNFFISAADLQKAKAAWHIDDRKCSIITYGVEQPLTIDNAASLLRGELELPNDSPILFFNGTMDYEPNYKAVEVIVNVLVPLLQKQLTNFTVVFTGNRMPPALMKKIKAAPHCIYKGYVEHVHVYYQGASLFINPITNDSGVKTKVIEALANNATVVSTLSGATGIPHELCCEKLIMVKDNNWPAFAKAIVWQLQQPKQKIAKSFYEYFGWENIVAKAASKINELILTNE